MKVVGLKRFNTPRHIIPSSLTGQKAEFDLVFLAFNLEHFGVQFMNQKF
jgi:hypothetical protein